MKKSMVLLAGLAALAVVVAIVWMTSVDRAIENALEYYGSEALGTQVSVASVTIRVAQGKGTIRGLRIAQPDGFGSGSAASFGGITLDFGVDSLISGDPYVVELAHVNAPEVTYVVAKDGRSNLSVLQENLARYSQSGEVDEAPSGEPTDVRIRIDRLEVERGQLEGDLTRLGLGRITAKLPSMKLDGVGGSKGAPPGEVTRIVGARFMAHTVNAIASSSIGRAMGGVVQQGTKALRGLFERLKGP